MQDHTRGKPSRNDGHTAFYTAGLQLHGSLVAAGHRTNALSARSAFTEHSTLMIRDPIYAARSVSFSAQAAVIESHVRVLASHPADI